MCFQTCLNITSCVIFHMTYLLDTRTRNVDTKPVPPQINSPVANVVIVLFWYNWINTMETSGVSISAEGQAKKDFVNIREID